MIARRYYLRDNPPVDIVDSMDYRDIVALRARAWIETINLTSRPAMAFSSRPPREGMD